MPQMMPINWILSFILFLLIFFMFIIMNYYILYAKMNICKKNLIYKQKMINWKW